MIEALIIRGFQAHARFELTLDPGVTCIVGSSDKGKSSILRALRWLCLNRPAGDAFVRKGAAKCVVSAVVDGKTVARVKAPGVNIYRLDGLSFKAIKQDVPQDVAALLAISDVNFQRQHDVPFWIGLPAGEVSRALNAVVDLARIDRCLAAAAASVRGAEQAEETCRRELAEAEQAVEDLKWVPKAVRDRKAVVEAERRAEDLRSSERRLVELMDRAAEVQAGLDEVGAKRADLEELAGQAREAAEAGRQAAAVKGVLERMTLLEDRLCRIADRSRRLERKLAGVRSCPVCRRPLKGLKSSPS